MKIDILYFSAHWCQPCKKLAPIIEELEKENEGFTITKLDLDTEAQKAIAYKIQAVPTLIFLNENADEVQRVIGLRSKKELQEIFDKVKHQ